MLAEPKRENAHWAADPRFLDHSLTVQQCLWSVSGMRTSVVGVLVGGRAGDTGIPGHASRLARQGHRDSRHAVLSRGGRGLEEPA